MSQINIRMDDNLKKQADELFNELGLNMSTAITMFIKQAVRQKGIPFEVSTKTDPFYSKENMRYVKEAVKSANEGKLTSHELTEV